MIKYIELTKKMIPSSYKTTREYVKKNNIEHIFKRKDKDNNWINSPEKLSNTLDKVFISSESFNKKYPIVDLNDSEKFKDENNNVIEIEIIGKREVDGIYFKALDIEKGFLLPRIDRTIKHCTSTYIENEDYIYLSSENVVNHDILGRQKLYLMYKGLLKLLFTTKNNKTSLFIKYATNILFISQFGTEEQKNKLVSDLKGVSYESIQELFNVNAHTMPCIYLTSFNKVSELRNIMNISNKYNDNDIVYKFGRTNNFAKRKDGHKSEYKDILQHINLKLVKFGFIDPLYIVQAETELKDKLSNYLIEYKNHNEIVVIPNNIFKLIESVFSDICKKYAGHSESFKDKIDILTKEIYELKLNEEKYLKEINYINNLHNKEIELLQKELDNTKKYYQLENEYKNYKIKQLEEFVLRNKTE